MRGVIVDAMLDGCPYVRLYLTDADGVGDLAEAAQRYDYVYAYSIVDLGAVDGFSTEQKWAQLLKLDGSSEEVFAGFNKKVRQEVRRTYRDEETTVVVDDLARSESYAFYRAIKEADGVAPAVEEDFGSVRWINGYHRGELVSSTSWFDSGAVLRTYHSATTRKEPGADTSLIGRLTRRLSWEACVLGVESGHGYVDLAGVDLHDPAKRGITEFKQGFGGETVEIYVYRRASERWQAAARMALERGRTVL